jgi:uncharacterized protein (TIGR03435 family)
MGPLFFDTEHTSLKELIAVAFKLEASQINGGPKWIDSDQFDVHARLRPLRLRKRFGDAARTSAATISS